MNKYLINNDCLYNEGKCELRNTKNAVTIKMTSMRARCLSYIIENAHNPLIEKQQLTTALWGSRGQFVSDANLTQLLYLIRRDLKALGILDFFITIPRLGIKVNDTITINQITGDAPAAAPAPFWKKITAHLAKILFIMRGKHHGE
ncbi:hypothetical protein [Enterobacter sp.]|uniref:winged helix-turn-helix domain-containing protein n=1 Tax=Enterobacter sp. TaxID=42895 RepID=UPI00296FD2C8|nr:hypothetical protein [Enterobacter sp.]